MVAGPLEGGTEVKINGAGLVGVSEVYFGDLKATRMIDGSGFAGQFMYVCSPPSTKAGKVRLTLKSPGGVRISPPSAVFEYSSSGLSNSNGANCLA